MSFMAQQELDSRSSTFSDMGSPADEGVLSAFGRLAINSLRAAELPRLDAFLSGKDGESLGSSDGMSSGDPGSPPPQAKHFDHGKVDPRDAGRDPRDERRKSRFMHRLMHR
jgi:hypothetical protein